MAVTATPQVRLGGVTLEGPSPFAWSLVRGVRPFEARWLVSEDCATKLEALLGAALELVFDARGNIKKVYPLEILPGPAGRPWLRTLIAKDLRWKWPYHHLAATFNRRRDVGDRYLANDQGAPENAITLATLAYEPTTLRPFGPQPGSSPWTAAEILEWLIATQPPDGIGESLRMDFARSGVPVEDLVLDDQAQNALERVLAYIGGVDLFVDRNGIVVVQDTRSIGGEVRAAATRRGRSARGPESLVVDRAAVMPAKVVSLFTVEAECLFTAAESDNSVPAITEDDSTLFNVGRVTDRSLTVAGTVLGRGSYATLLDLFAAWGAFGQGPDTLSIKQLRELYLEGNGTVLAAWYGKGGGADDAVGLERIRETLMAWRRLYRIAPVFFGRLESVAPVRAAVVSPEHGTRAPSAAYCDHIRRPSARGLLVRGNALLTNGAVVRGYAGGALGSTAVEAPVTVVLEDAAVGILRLIPKLDPQGFFDAIVLGSPEDGVLPTVSLAESNRRNDARFRNWGLIDLEAGWDLGVVLSVVPGTPQNRQRFYAVSMALGGRGPVLYSRIGPGITTARFAWSDEHGDVIKDAIRGNGDWQALSHLLANPDHVDAVARANKERIDDLFRTRTYGAHDVDMDIELEPVGSLSSVTHSMTGGALESSLRFDPDAQPYAIWHKLEASTRNALLRVLASRRGARLP